MCTLLYYYTILYYTVLYCTVLYCTVLYCTVLYYTILYNYTLYTFSSFWWLHSDIDRLTKCTKVIVSINSSTLHMCWYRQGIDDTVTRSSQFAVCK